MTIKHEEALSPSKSADKVAVSAKRPTKKKPKDKPKRPLSAYNFFFKEEREKILKVVLSDGPKDNVNEPDSEDHIDEATLKRLRKEGGKVSFEEMGKLIGNRWKNLQPDRLTKYSELAAEDTDRYKKEMQTYNGRQEAKMRSEALKPTNGGYQEQEPKASSSSGSQRPPMSSYEMPGPGASYGGSAPPMQGPYGYPGPEYAGYPGMHMGAMYGYGGYPGMGPEMGGHPSMMPPEMHGAQPGPEYTRGHGGMYNGFQGGMMGYGGQGPPPPPYQGQMPPGMEHPQGPGPYGYGPHSGQGWAGPHS